jgi:ABC-type sugar transport system ATPase subunit
MHALAVGDHFAVLIRGQLAANFRKGEKSREEITDLMAGGEDMAELEAQITAEGEEFHSPAHVRASQAEKGVRAARVPVTHTAAFRRVRSTRRTDEVVP